MKVTMKEAVSTSHTIYRELEESVKIKEQPGLAVTCVVDTGFAGGQSTCFNLSLAKGATLDLPKRLAERLIKLDFAKAAPSRKISDGAD